MKFRTIFKVVLFIFKAVHGIAPSNITSTTLKQGPKSNRPRRLETEPVGPGESKNGESFANTVSHWEWISNTRSKVCLWLAIGICLFMLLLLDFIIFFWTSENDQFRTEEVLWILFQFIYFIQMSSAEKVRGPNRPFAGSSHMVRNKLHWDANDAVGLSKQRKVGLDW